MTAAANSMIVSVGRAVDRAPVRRGQNSGDGAKTRSTCRSREGPETKVVRACLDCQSVDRYDFRDHPADPNTRSRKYQIAPGMLGAFDARRLSCQGVAPSSNRGAKCR